MNIEEFLSKCQICGKEESHLSLKNYHTFYKNDSIYYCLKNSVFEEMDLLICYDNIVYLHILSYKYEDPEQIFICYFNELKSYDANYLVNLGNRFYENLLFI